MGKEDSGRKIPPVADRLVTYFKMSETPLVVDQNGEAHALVKGQALPIARTSRFLTELIYEYEDRAPTNDGLVGAKRVLDMLAHKSGNVRELHTRAAFYEGAVFYQLGPGRVVRVDERGWELDPNPPILFRSVKNLRELPNPTKGASLQNITKLVNLKTERDQRLFLAYITLVTLPHIPRPILQTTGVMGSGKSTACRVVKRLLDPTNSEAVAVDRRDFLQKASHCYLMMLDNQNSLPEWALDTLCRLVTGESDSKRVLYSDDEDLVWSMKRGVLLNGINPPSDRSDVQDRTLPIELSRIDKRARVAEDDFWLEFSLAQPELLGTVFDALSGALRERHTVKLEERPRLADWGLYAAALYESQGWGVEKFKEDWQGVEEAQQQGTLDGSVVAQVVILYMMDRTRIELSATKLHTALETRAEDFDLELKNDRQWPKTGRILWKKIKEVIPLLEAYGIRASRGTSNKAGHPIILEKTNSDDGRQDAKKGDDNCAGDDKGTINFPISSPTATDSYRKGDDNGTGGRYFGVTNSSDPKKENGHPESNTELSSPSSSRADNPQDAALITEGWEPRDRGDNTMWISPNNGFAYSREMALKQLAKGS